MQLLMLAAYRSEKYQKAVKFLFPSSIATYGMTLEEKRAAGCVKEDEYNAPHTMYGCNKLYCEQLGRYYALVIGNVTAQYPLIFKVDPLEGVNTAGETRYFFRA